MSRVALVVGGSGGIGKSIVRRLAEDGLRVVIGYRTNEAAARHLLEELQGADHTALELDVTAESSLVAGVAALRESYGRLDILVNGAGVTTPVAHDDLDGLEDDMISKIFDVNWRGPRDDPPFPTTPQTGH